MKKSLMMAFMLVLPSCGTGGEIDFLPWRREFVETWNAYNIEYLQQGPRFLKSENVVDKSYVPNELLSLQKGNVIATEATYQKDYYVTEKLRINENGVLNTASVPETFKRGEIKDVIGVSKVEENELFLVPSQMDTFVYLVNDDGTFYKKMGQIRHGKLIVLDPDFFPYPKTLRFETVTTTTVEQTDPVKGYELKFSGLRNGQVVLTYFDYSEADSQGKFEDFIFENKPETIAEVHGIKIKIMSADENKLDFLIIE